MIEIPADQILKRLRFENPWWETGRISDAYSGLPRRAYFSLISPLIEQTEVRRAVVLMGPRRVGKTVLLHQSIQSLIDSGVDRNRICYASLETPLFNNLSLEDLLHLFMEAHSIDPTNVTETLYFFADEIQYLRDWEIHLKSLVDSYPGVKAVVSGSAAAALRLKSIESGAGRFTDFLLPPLTFHEFLDLQGITDLVSVTDGGSFTCGDIDQLNEHFADYLNFGGYPEALFSPGIQQDLDRFIRSDIIDKVLLRDLPSLYGVTDIQELNSLFTTLAFNTASEVSLEGLSKGSGVAKTTIRRYIEYLEAAFLIKVVHRIDRAGRRFKRANFFKVYLTNPSMRAALFSTVDQESPEMGALAETAAYSQWFHASNSLYYARWAHGGEVDIVSTDSNGQPDWCVEVKWSDRTPDRVKDDLRSLLAFSRDHKDLQTSVTTRTRFEVREIDHGRSISFYPTSLHCWIVGHELMADREWRVPLFIE